MRDDAGRSDEAALSQAVVDLSKKQGVKIDPQLAVAVHTLSLSHTHTNTYTHTLFLSHIYTRYVTPSFQSLSVNNPDL